VILLTVQATQRTRSFLIKFRTHDTNGPTDTDVSKQPAVDTRLHCRQSGGIGSDKIPTFTAYKQFSYLSTHLTLTNLPTYLSQSNLCDSFLCPTIHLTTYLHTYSKNATVSRNTVTISQRCDMWHPVKRV